MGTGVSFSTLRGCSMSLWISVSRGGWVSGADLTRVVAAARLRLWTGCRLTFVNRVACDWWHGVPQLFWQYAYLPETLPRSCAKVELLPVAM